uniref:Aminotransferase family protein n=1 Tax=Rhizophora mucronata TaxID=61149 RepID=A0A2P2IWN9_RHIMU
MSVIKEIISDIPPKKERKLSEFTNVTAESPYLTDVYTFYSPLQNFIPHSLERSTESKLIKWYIKSNLFPFPLPQTVERIKKYFDILGGPATFIQAAVPRIIEETDEVFFKKTIATLKQTSDICYDKITEISCITCPHRPEGSMAVMMKLNLALLEDIRDDTDFCFKLAREESVIVLPGTAVGLKNWIRITFAADPALLEEALGRLKFFCQRHTSRVLGA